MSDTTKATPSPRPTPPKPGQFAKRAAVKAIPQTNPEQWGRVDEDGSAWVKTPDGERQIGTWQAGDPEEGLVHFARRFDNLVTEVVLLERRLDTHPTEAVSTREHAQSLLESLPTAAVIGDITSLTQRLTRVIEESYEAESKAQEIRAHRREAAIARKTALVEEAEDIGANATNWKQAGDRLHEILDEWKTIHGIDRKTDDALWKRFSRARESFNRRRGSHFAELDRVRAAAARTKEELVAKAESLQDSEDWNATSAEYRDLMAQWKKAGRAQKEVDDALWNRFKAAQDKFFGRRKAVLDERDSEFAENGKAKSALLDEYADRILELKNPEEAHSLLSELSGKWDQIGRVPRNDLHKLEDAMRNLERHVSQLEKAEWQRTDPAVQARAQQFWDRVEEFTQQAEKAEKAGRAKDAEKARQQARQWEEWAKAAADSLQEM